MTGLETLLLRGALGIAAAGVALSAMRSKQLQQVSCPAFDKTMVRAFAASRLAIYGLLFFIFHLEPRGDIPAYYLSEARAVLHGLLPYRDYPSSYAPLHPYLDALVLLVWNSSLALILFAILVECLLLPVWLRLGRLLFPEERVRLAAILYLASPISLQFVTVDGQDNVMIALLLALALLFLYRCRAALSGVLLALAIVLFKFLPLLYAPSFFLAARRRVRWAVSCCAVLVVGYGAFALLRLPLLFPLQEEGSFKTAGNLPYLLESILGRDIPAHLEDALVLFVVTAVLGVVAWALTGASDVVRLKIVCFSMAALTLALVLLSKKSWPPYLMLALFPICVLIPIGRGSTARVVLFEIFSVVAITEHSYWSSLFHQQPMNVLHAGLAAGYLDAWILLLFELLLLAGYGWLLYEALVQTVYLGIEARREAHAALP